MILDLAKIGDAHKKNCSTISLSCLKCTMNSISMKPIVVLFVEICGSTFQTFHYVLNMQCDYNIPEVVCMKLVRSFTDCSPFPNSKLVENGMHSFGLNANRRCPRNLLFDNFFKFLQNVQ